MYIAVVVVDHKLVVVVVVIVQFVDVVVVVVAVIVVLMVNLVSIMPYDLNNILLLNVHPNQLYFDVHVIVAVVEVVDV